MRKSIFVLFIITSLLLLPLVFSISTANVGQTVTNNFINSSNVTNVIGLNTLQALNGSLIIQNGTVTNISVNQSFVQYRVNDSCATGSSIRVINADGTVTCETDSTGSGTVTSVGLSSNNSAVFIYNSPITSSGVFDLWIQNASVFQDGLMTSTQATSLNAKALAGNCPSGQFVQNATTAGVQCFTPSSSGGLDFYPNITALQTSNTSIYTYLDGLWLNLSALQSSNGTVFNLLNGISGNVSYVNNSLNNLNTTVQSLLTSNTTIFSRLDSVALNVTFVNNSLNNLNITVQSLLTSNTTIFARLTGLFDNVTYVNNSLNNLNITVQSLLTSNTTIFSRLTGLSSNITYVNDSLNNVNSTFRTNDTLLNNMINTLNSSKSGIGTVTCATGTVMQNLTLSSGVPTVQCVTDATGGGGVSDGNKTDISVSGTGTIWTVNAYAINSSKLNTTNSPSAGQYPAYASNGQFTWTTPSASGGSATPPAYAYYNYWAKTEWESITAVYTLPWVPTAIASGTTALLPGRQNHPAIANISTSTTANSGYCYQITGATTFTLQNATYTELIFRPTNSTPATLSGNRTTIRFGFQDVFTATSSPVDGVFFNITSNATGGVVNFTAHTINNSVMTASPLIYQGSALSPSASTNWYRLYIGIVNHTQADFRIYNSTSGTLLGSYLINATIPTTVGRETSHAVCGYGVGAVATARGIAELDYMSININQTLVR